VPHAIKTEKGNKQKAPESFCDYSQNETHIKCLLMIGNAFAIKTTMKCNNNKVICSAAMKAVIFSEHVYV